MFLKSIHKRKWRRKLNLSKLTSFEKHVLEYMLDKNIMSFEMRYRANHYDKESYKVEVMLDHNRSTYNYLFNLIDVYLIVTNEANKQMTLNEYIIMRNDNIFDDHYWGVNIREIYNSFIRLEK